MADAYVKHFTHLIDQAVFDEQLGEARQFQRLRTRLLRESTGLVLLIPRKSGPVHEREVAAIPVHEPAPFGTLGED